MDYSGDETYSGSVRDVATGSAVGETLEGLSGGMQWGRDSTVLFYITQDHAKRPYRLCRCAKLAAASRSAAAL